MGLTMVRKQLKFNNRKICIFKKCISVYRSAEKFLTDKRGEFANGDFIQLRERSDIIVKS